MDNYLKEITEIYTSQDNSAYGKLYNNLLPYREFPVDIFPAEIQNSLSFYIKKHNCLPDYIYNAFLCALSVAHGTKAIMKARGLNADARLWYMSLGSSSRGKSEPAKNIFRYFRELDDSAKDEYDKEKEQYIKDEMIYKQKISSVD